jgi:virginiamycin A acetyltransferase
VKITPVCNRIGLGAVIGAGTVVTKDIPEFAVAIGIPAKIFRFRFQEDFQSDILDSRLWECPFESLTKVKEYNCQPASKLELALILEKIRDLARPFRPDVSR